jgi:phosphate transport system substrate-binding protein
MKTRSTLSTLIIIGLLVQVLAACSPDVVPGGADQVYQGTITISGAWALYPMVIRWGEEFQAIHPQVRFDISAGGAGKGMADALADAVDIGMVSREIYPQEQEQGALAFAVAKDAVFLTVNSQNPVWEDLRSTGITAEELAGIYITGEITSWEDLTGSQEGTNPIHVFTRSDACGAAETWAAYLGQRQEDLLGIGVYGDPGVLESVYSDPLAIGFNNLNYAFDSDTGSPVLGIQVVPLDVNDNGQVDPGEVIDLKEQALEAVRSGVYPSPPARDLYLVTKGQPQGLVREFVLWVISDGQGFVSETGYIPISSEKLDLENQKLGN